MEEFSGFLPHHDRFQSCEKQPSDRDLLVAHLESHVPNLFYQSCDRDLVAENIIINQVLINHHAFIYIMLYSLPITQFTIHSIYPNAESKEWDFKLNKNEIYSEELRSEEEDEETGKLISLVLLGLVE